MGKEEKKGITVKVSTSIHAEVKKYLEEHGQTMAEFVETALQDELHPKIKTSEEKKMENMRTMAIQLPESLFKKIKEYLQRNRISQKQFVLGLIEKELNREQAEIWTQDERKRLEEERVEEEQENPVEGKFEAVEEGARETINQGEIDPEGISERETQDEDLIENQEENEEMVMKM